MVEVKEKYVNRKYRSVCSHNLAVSLNAHISSVRILTELRPSQSCVHFQQQQDILFPFSWALVKRLALSAAPSAEVNSECSRNLSVPDCLLA
jgi:hypothetical protein